jgi:HD-GYP domain-containing protein (c-di-GMP phosphodiesterase class II)
MQQHLKINLKNVLWALSEVADIASPTIARHQQRTALIATEIAKYSNVNRILAQTIFGSALLHDIGALSVEEKLSLHAFETQNYQTHCNRGAILLEKVPWLKQAAQIVRNHHTIWTNLDGRLDDPVIFASQVVNLADFVERMIDRNRYILHQTQDIVEKVQKLRGIAIHDQIIDVFLELAKREEFWLKLVSHYSMFNLFVQDSYYEVESGLPELSLLAEMFRNIIDFKSPFTATHSSGVSACAGKLAELYGFSATDLELIKIAGNLHDLGKMAISNRILEKSGRLTNQEFAIIKSHPFYTYYVIKPLDELNQVAEWAAFHHEKLDSSGYPFHRHAAQIDIGARIMAVADIFTAIAEDRPYRPGMTKAEIYKILQQQAMQGLIEVRIIDLLFDNYDLVNKYVREKQAISRDFYENQFLYGT